MRMNLRTVLWFISVTTLCSCKKQTTNESTIEHLQEKIISWLAQQKSPTQPLKAANVDLLVKNLEFSKLTTEDSHGGEQFAIIPVNDQFKRLKNIDGNCITVVVLKLTKAGNIRAGNLVLFIPSKGQQSIPKNTFYNIFNTAHPNCDGTFKFLSVSGTRLYELSYDDGNLSRVARISSEAVDGKTTSCIDWYLITTIYYSDGSTSQTKEYVGTTCAGCDCGTIECLCPPDGSGGNPEQYEYEEERICSGTYRNTPFTIPLSDGSGNLYFLQALTKKSYRVRWEKDYFLSCYLVRSDVVNNTQGATSTVSNYQKTGIGTPIVTATATGTITWPDQSTLTFTESWQIQLGHVSWNCN
jgi:hypothetical protein